MILRLLLAALALVGAAQAEPLRLGPLTLDATHQARLAHLADQFREGAPGDDTLLSLRTTVDAQLRLDVVRVEVEVADIRAHLADANTPLNTGMIDPLDLLQAHAGVEVPIGAAALRARIGRTTLDLGSRQLMARNRFRNGINAFDGVLVDWTAPGLEAHAFAFAPVTRLPDTPEGLADNALEFDAPQFDDWLYGGFVHRAFSPDLHAEVYVFLLDAAEGRRLTTPGFRLYRPRARGAVDAWFELMVQVGEASPEVDHRAASGHLALGYTFAAWATPHLSLLYDFASGDRDPDDAVDQRFDPLFGIARPDFGPTGLWTAFSRRNISTPGLRAEARPHPRLDGMLDVRAVWLDQARDAWVGARLRDPTGASDPYVGEQVEVRVRWQAVPRQATVEIGGAWLHQGAFVDARRPDAADPLYGYLQLNLTL